MDKIEKGRSLKTEYAVCTCKGPFRKNNQDNYFLNGCIKDMDAVDGSVSHISKEKAQLFAVCDGMGGLKNSELAAFMTVEKLADMDRELDTYPLKADLQNINDIIYRKAVRGSSSMGTTIALLKLEKNRALIGNVGDSRIYLVRSGELYLLTRDHTEFQLLMEAGICQPEDVNHHKSKNQLTQWVGMDPGYSALSPDFTLVQIKKGDVFILCTDGVYMKMEDQLVSAVKEHNSAEEITRILTADAINKGSKDNVTAMVVMIR